MNLFEYLKKYKIPYDENKVRGYILLYKKQPDSVVGYRAKDNILRSLSLIIMKNSNNFFNHIKGVQKERILHTLDDVIGECYIIIDRCLNAFDLSKKKKFIHYCNRAIGFGLTRIALKQYKVMHNDINDDKTILKGGDDVHDPLLLENLGLTKLEIMFINFLIKQYKKERIMVLLKIDRVIFNEMLSKIKTKLSRYFSSKNENTRQ